ncbi:MAG: hypothetical protein JWM56_835 [Candidatus Peribacteria bacterium]|nr:hypothetical protein [Candidatus Peribacteria bacterium]
MYHLGKPYIELDGLIVMLVNIPLAIISTVYLIIGLLKNGLLKF